MLASGGLDSSALVAHMARKGSEVFPLYVRSGLIWEAAELDALKRFLSALPSKEKGRVRRLKVVSLPMRDVYGAHWSTTGAAVPGWRAADNSVYLPGRNILLIAKAATYAALLGAPRVAIGLLKGNPFPDASPRFLGALRRALSLGLDFPLKVQIPFKDFDKTDLVLRFQEYPLDLTFSCSNPRARQACRACAKCRERILAFRAVPNMKKESAR